MLKKIHADVCFYVASAPEHVQIAEVAILATHQASPFLIARKKERKLRYKERELEAENVGAVFRSGLYTMNQ